MRDGETQSILLALWPFTHNHECDPALSRDRTEDRQDRNDSRESHRLDQLAAFVLFRFSTSSTNPKLVILFFSFIVVVIESTSTSYNHVSALEGLASLQSTEATERLAVVVIAMLSRSIAQSGARAARSLALRSGSVRMVTPAVARRTLLTLSAQRSLALGAQNTLLSAQRYASHLTQTDDGSPSQLVALKDTGFALSLQCG